MLRNYIKIALRILWQNKIYVAINLLSLAFALTCCIFSYLNYDYRMSFDKSHTNTENIYRLNSIRKTERSTQRWGITPAPIGEIMAKDLPGVSGVARLYSENVVLKKGENVFNERVHYADKNIFSFFNFPLREGNYAQFDNINTVAISDGFARKYFGTEKALGQQIEMVKDGRKEFYTVAAVMKPIPLNSSFQFDIVTAFNNAFAAGTTNDWRNNKMITTFAEIKNKEAVIQLAEALKTYTAVHNNAHEDWTIEGFYFQPFNEVAMSSDVDFDEFVHGRDLNANQRGVIVYIPTIMSILILLITCFNFTNISIAFASKRLKEIGVRKVLGGRKRQLIKQFLTENIILCLLASLIALGLVLSLLPSFNSWAGITLQFDVLANPTLLVFLLLLPLATAIIAGLYPAFYVSSFEPIGILKGSVTFGPKSRLTRFLLFLQFTISCLALILGILLTKNASYQNEVDFGYAINEVVVTEVDNAQEYTALSNMLRKDSRILSVGGAVDQLAAGTRSTKVTTDKAEVKAQVASIGGEEYLNTMGIKLTEGRHFYKTGGLDKDQSVIVNETLVKQMHLQNPIGQQIKVDSAYYAIVGVVADYKEFGLHGKVPPCVLRAAVGEDFKYLVVRTSKNNLADVQQATREGWAKVAPDKVYNGFLQIDMIDKERYMNESLKTVSFFLAGVIILLSASGLFALVSLNIIRRSKEVGMRKVLGASVLNLMKLVSKDFLYIIIVAFVVGASLGYIIIDKIIFRFVYAYHPEIEVSAFIGALAIVLASSLATVGWKVYSAASSNPMYVLRKD